MTEDTVPSSVTGMLSAVSSETIAIVLFLLVLIWGARELIPLIKDWKKETKPETNERDDVNALRNELLEAIKKVEASCVSSDQELRVYVEKSFKEARQERSQMLEVRRQGELNLWNKVNDVSEAMNRLDGFITGKYGKIGG